MKLFLPFSSRKEDDSFSGYPINPTKLTLELSAMYKEVWGSNLIPRDVIYNIYIGPNCKCGVEFYNPAFFARQFGLTQMISLPPFNSLNADFIDREIIADKSSAKKVKAKYFNKLKEFSFISFQELPYSTNHFDNWWCKWIKSIQNLPLTKTLKLIILQKKTDSADPAEETSSSNTKTSSPQPAGKKRKAAASKGKPDAQAICKFEHFTTSQFTLSGKNG